MAPKNPLDTPLAAEIQLRGEQAHALKRVARTLESLLDELSRLQAGLETLPHSAREGQRARHRELRAEAEKYLWYLVVQREAMGLWNHDDVHALYRVPPPL
jgi:hypothetical protein